MTCHEDLIFYQVPLSQQHRCMAHPEKHGREEKKEILKLKNYPFGADALYLPRKIGFRSNENGSISRFSLRRSDTLGI